MHAMSISLQLRAYKPGDHVICHSHISLLRMGPTEQASPNLEQIL